MTFLCFVFTAFGAVALICFAVFCVVELFTLRTEGWDD